VGRLESKAAQGSQAIDYGLMLMLVAACHPLIRRPCQPPAINLIAPAMVKPGLLQASGMAFAYLLPILNILVPQTGQTPWVAGLPFFIVIAFAFFISRLVRHLTQ